uniref:NADH dehydrogenase subunit 5 n=1 Tax=Geniotrigona thoracica TaxID=395500 RepID=UPI003D4287CC
MMKMLIFGIMLFLMSLFMIFNSLYLMMMNLDLFFEWNILSFNSMKMNMMLYFNYKTLIYIFLVMFISSMIMIYSIDYMNINNILIKRFYYLMMMFLFSMIILIVSPNMLTIMLGWDMLGLTSYCLIIYFNKMSSFNSGMTTIILNRLGDVSLLMIISMMSAFGSWNLLIYKMDNMMMLMMIIMSITKSAQFPFFVWLPMAMMAPTPVSSLVHSSTLVTAGIYLMIIYNNMMDLKYKNIIMLLSSITMLLSGLMANFEMDFKKIVAMSTLSQLGFMMSMLSMNMYELTFLHLFIHALFKSMMFMCVGSFIHYMKGMQNFRFYKGMFYIYPMKSMFIFMSLMMMCGFPFLVGFYSKDMMIESYMTISMNLFSFIMLMIGTIMTISYSMRIMKNLMSNNLNMKIVYNKESFIMNFVMMIMMLFMLFLSKIIHDLMFIIKNYNIMIVYKYFVFKMFLFGFMFMKFFDKLNFVNLLLLMKNMFYMINMFKLFKYKYFINLNNYSINMEKMFIEKFLSNINMTILMLNKKFSLKVEMSIYSIMSMYMYFVFILIFY